MIARFLMALSAAFSLSLSAQEPADFEYGNRPALPVFDPNGFLDPRISKDISGPLAKIYKEEGIDVVVVILSDLEGAPPEHVANRFSSAWCTSPIHAIVLHVPGRADGPWIVPAGKLIHCVKPEVIDQTVSDARRNASREPTESAKVRAASTEAADMLRYWMGTAINRSEDITSARVRIRLEQETKARNWRIATLMGAASAIPLLAGIPALYFLLRKPGPRHFPETKPPRRLGAPHAGGNHAVADIGPPLP